MIERGGGGTRTAASVVSLKTPLSFAYDISMLWWWPQEEDKEGKGE
jgi:hypothetical protein